jgi:hypothetical protein
MVIEQQSGVLVDGTGRLLTGTDVVAGSKGKSFEIISLSRSA